MNHDAPSLLLLRLYCTQEPWHWFPPPGQKVLIFTPQTTKVTDVVGEQQGVKYWAGLRDVMDRLLDGFWSRVPWARHSCDQCRRAVILDDQEVVIQAAALDGIRNTRGFKCATYGCPLDLGNTRGAR